MALHKMSSSLVMNSSVTNANTAGSTTSATSLFSSANTASTTSATSASSSLLSLASNTSASSITIQPSSSLFSSTAMHSHTHDATSISVDGRKYEIKDVWAYNFQQELNHIMSLLDKYPCVAMDTEFPGIVARPVGSFKHANEYHYQTLKCNVDMLKIIQLGISLSDQQGNSPEGCNTWQFNFKFSLSEDMYAQDSIDMLSKAGIDFKRHDEQGIDFHEFGASIMMSGLVLSDNITWISFHSGFDFAYFLKLVSCLPLPEEENEFFELLQIYFPNVYDIKYLMKSCESLHGGLQSVSDDLKVKRIGPQHQAGSDSLLTSHVFFKLRSQFFDNVIDDTKFLNQIYGLGFNTRNMKKSS